MVSRKKIVSNRKILFVCTGNVFRSLSAEYCLKNFLKKKKINNTTVTSAGTVAKIQPVSVAALDELKKLGIDASAHKIRKLTKRDLIESEVVIVMAKNHKDFIREKFGFDNVVLFNYIAHGEQTSVLDDTDVYEDIPSNKRAIAIYIRKTIRYINGSIPKLYDKLDSYFLFSDLISGRMKINSGFPFIPIHETKNSIAFMSIQIPQHIDGHILVVPKKRYTNLEYVPKPELKELIESISLIGRAVAATHDGYNVLLNNGSAAGQYIMHTHFHIVPRNRNDKIKIEVWKDKKLARADYLKYVNKIKGQIAAIRDRS